MRLPRPFGRKCGIGEPVDIIRRLWQPLVKLGAFVWNTFRPIESVVFTNWVEVRRRFRRTWGDLNPTLRRFYHPVICVKHVMAKKMAYLLNHLLAESKGMFSDVFKAIDGAVERSDPKHNRMSHQRPHH